MTNAQQPVTITPTIWYDNPDMAAAVLGYIDGKLGMPATPPNIHKGKLRTTYMREYKQGKKP